jgi:hypothetical protein
MTMERKIYFLGVTPNGPIKIGISKRPELRRHLIAMNMPYRVILLASAVGTVTIESALHRHFEDSKLLHEWFERTPELLALIENIKTGSEWPDFARTRHCSRCRQTLAEVNGLEMAPSLFETLRPGPRQTEKAQDGQEREDVA